MYLGQFIPAKAGILFVMKTKINTYRYCGELSDVTRPIGYDTGGQSPYSAYKITKFNEWYWFSKHGDSCLRRNDDGRGRMSLIISEIVRPDEIRSDGPDTLFVGNDGLERNDLATVCQGLVRRSWQIFMWAFWE